MADLLAKLAADGVLNPDAASLLDGDESVGRRTVVLVGVTGDGKSSTGNTLCGSKVFASSSGLASVTQELAHADYLCRDSFWRVIDTVGLQDTGLSQKEVLDRFSTFADRAEQGIDAFLFIVRWGRFKPEHDSALAAFAANCGETALRHTILVFTHCGLSEEDFQRTISDSAAPAALCHWLQRLGGGAVGIDNYPSGIAEESLPPDARDKLQDALDRLLTMNSGLRYSNEALAEARARMAASEEGERAAFEAAVAEWRRGTGPVTIEREAGVITRPPIGAATALSEDDTGDASNSLVSGTGSDHR
eukprot:TRINITY_DN8056_c2_g1_i3.p1 TRINITY_DN8056_c2_g1~~TRINITY_DN8056_c2_g1_i3.p1  ORF type:complete len:318 (+),score=69.80 TRINITY_DN8056_c2_g1_i3:40-954(+)